MKKIAALEAKKSVYLDQMQAIVDAAGEGALTEEQQKQYDSLKAQVQTATDAIKRETELLELRKTMPAVETSEVGDVAPESKPIRIPATANRWSGNLRAFKGPGGPEKAYKAGQWLRASLMNLAPAQRWCREHGVPIVMDEGGPQIGATVQTEMDNQYGGFLVPDEWENEIINLAANYGVFRREARIRPMARETKIIPRRTGGLTAYAVGENQAITTSSKTWDKVQLIAKSWGVLDLYSAELAEDTIISMVDDLTEEMARAFAYKEDMAGFVGDGTSTYHGIEGVSIRLRRIHTTAGAGTAATSDTYGMATGAGNTFAELTVANFNTMMSLLRSDFWPNAKFYMSSKFFHAVCMRLAYALTGNNVQIYGQGGPEAMWMGKPVVFTDCLPTADANSQVPVLFGDLRKAASFGDRRGVTIALTNSGYTDSTDLFANNLLAIRATTRWDIVAHDVGTYNTSLDTPIVGIIMADS